MLVNGRIILAAVVLSISCFVIANALFKTYPVNITIEDGTPAVIQVPAVYGEIEVLTLIVTSWIAGISTMYLYFESSRKTLIMPEKPMATQGHVGSIPKLKDLETINTALKVLREPGKKVLETIVDKGGEILQKDLYLETNFSKAKISRTLRELENRNIIQRRQYGGTKKIVLSDWMKKGII